MGFSGTYMRPRIILSRFLLRLGRFIESLTVIIMRPDDLVEFSRRNYDRPGNAEAMGKKGDVAQGLYRNEESLLEKVPKKQGNFLVLGLGGGREVIPLVRMGFTVTGVDFAPSMVEQTRANLAGCGLVARLLLQEISQLNVPEDVYDIVWLSSGMYSSVPTRKRRVTMLRKIRNALVPGGYFVCMFFWDPGLSHSRKGLLARKFMACLLVGNIGYEPGDMLLHNIEFIHAFSSEKSLRSEFAEAGFEVIHLHLPDENKRGEAVLMKS